MARKPLTFFVFLATSGSSFFKAAAQRQQSASLQEFSRGRLQGSAAQLISDAAVVCVIPITSVFRGRILGQSVPASETLTSVEIVKEVCLAIILALLSALVLKIAVPNRMQVQSPAVQPTKGACSAAASPQNGLATCLLWSPWTWLSHLWQLGRRCQQRRRLYIHKTVTRLEGILPSLECLSSTGIPLRRDLPRACAPGSHGLHDWHEALPAGFLTPIEVAACRSPPEVCAFLQRLLADRWWELEMPQPPLESVPEDECLLLEESPAPEFPELMELSQ